MKTLKKISPLEFRLHSRRFVNDYTPFNYFEKLRFTILFSRLLFWFFRRYGLYLFSYKLRILEDQFLFQFFYYRTRQNKRYFKAIWWRKFSRVGIPFRAKRKKRRRKYRKLWKFLTRRLFKVKKRRINQTKVKKFRRQSLRELLWQTEWQTEWQKELRKLRLVKFYRLHEQVLFMFHWQRKKYEKYRRSKIFHAFRKRQYRSKRFKSVNRSRRIKPSRRSKNFKYFKYSKQNRYFQHANRFEQPKRQMRSKKIFKGQRFNFFFVYFFIYFFKLQSLILYKSLYKYLISNRFFKAEHTLVLKRMGYIQEYNWAFDFLFLFHSAINFINFDFILPFFIYQVKRSYKQRPFLNILFNLLKFLYYIKTNIYGIKVLVHGPYDRHGRSRTILFRLGTVSLTSYNSFILYDTAQWATFYGAIQIKMWILYSVPYYSKENNANI